MTKKRMTLRTTYTVLLVMALCLIVWLAVQSRLSSLPYEAEAAKVTDVTWRSGNDTGEISLPAKFKNSSANSTVTIYAEIDASQRESLLVKSVFSPVRVYFDGALAFEYGNQGEYPCYMNDPPTIITIVPIPAKDDVQQLKIEYVFPSQRNELSLPALYIGSENALLARLFYENGFSVLFSLVLFLLAVGMILISAVFVRSLPSGYSFMWLGLFSLATSAWIFGECDLAAFLLPYPSLLYAMDYLGLFLLGIPFLRFGLITLTPKNKLPLTVLLYVHYVSVTGALLLQLCGIVDLMKSLYLFHIITPLAFVVFAVDLFLEYFRYGNQAAKRFALAAALLACSSVLELLNYWLGITNMFTLIFQLGMLVFVISLGIMSGQYIQSSMRTAMEKQRLEYEVDGMSRQITLQRHQYERLAESIEQTRAARHDLRHQLTVLKSYAAAGGLDKINSYLEELTENLSPIREGHFCQNYAVNSVVNHYFDLSVRIDTEVSARLDIPEIPDHLSEMDLCVIIGNLLENAVEACARMQSGTRFIRIYSRVQGKYLTLSVENSFDGIWHERNGKYFSRKNESHSKVREGVGISSVRAICEKYDGLLRVTAEDKLWCASALMRIPTSRG